MASRRRLSSSSSEEEELTSFSSAEHSSAEQLFEDGTPSPRRRQKAFNEAWDAHEANPDDKALEDRAQELYDQLDPPEVFEGLREKEAWYEGAAEVFRHHPNEERILKVLKKHSNEKNVGELKDEAEEDKHGSSTMPSGETVEYDENDNEVSKVPWYEEEDNEEMVNDARDYVQTQNDFLRTQESKLKNYELLETYDTRIKFNRDLLNKYKGGYKVLRGLGMGTAKDIEYQLKRDLKYRQRLIEEQRKQAERQKKLDDFDKKWKGNKGFFNEVMHAQATYETLKYRGHEHNDLGDFIEDDGGEVPEEARKGLNKAELSSAISSKPAMITRDAEAEWTALMDNAHTEEGYKKLVSIVGEEDALMFLDPRNEFTHEKAKELSRQREIPEMPPVDKDEDLFGAGYEEDYDEPDPSPLKTRRQRAALKHIEELENEAESPPKNVNKPVVHATSSTSSNVNNRTPPAKNQRQRAALEHIEELEKEEESPPQVNIIYVNKPKNKPNKEEVHVTSSTSSNVSNRIRR